MKVRIDVMAWRDSGAIRIKVTEGLFTFVAIDDQARPRPVAAGAPPARFRKLAAGQRTDEVKR